MTAAPLFHVPILLLVLQLFRSTRCPARPAAHFRPRPGSGGGRAMYAQPLGKVLPAIWQVGREGG